MPLNRRSIGKIVQLAPETLRKMICPRCGSLRKPIGPRLALDGWGRECWRYACDGCGYRWNEPVRHEAPRVVNAFIEAPVPVRVERREAAGGRL